MKSTQHMVSPRKQIKHQVKTSKKLKISEENTLRTGNSKQNKTNLKTYSFEEVKDIFIGKKGSPKRDSFEIDLKLDCIGETIRQTRIKRNLTQEQLGELVGVQKAQISKLENNFKDARINTIIKVFEALQAKIKFSIEL